jgi:MoaA/NifB/PqqE/SkfB family radical SAM enzyme
MATFVEKFKLLWGLASGDTARVGPFFVCVDVTLACNLKCVGCRFHADGAPKPTSKKSERTLSVETFSRLCDDLKKMDTATITLTGQGEPLMHPRIIELIRIAKASGLRVNMTTNGTLLDENRAAGLVDAGLDSLRISLWASSADEYVKNYPGTTHKHFDAIINGIGETARLKKERGVDKPKIVIHHPVTKNNYKRIREITGLAHRSGANAVTFAPLRAYTSESESLSLAPDEERSFCDAIQGMREELKTLALDHNIDETLLRYEAGPEPWRKLPCYIGWLYARVQTDGKVYACHRSPIPMGDLKKERLPDIWKGPGYRAFRRTAMTLKGLASMQKGSECGYCGFVEENTNVHKIFKWLSPLVARETELEKELGLK